MAQPQKGDLLSGRYEIEELLGEGAMGRVWRARDRTSGQAVAVKVLKADGPVDPRLLKRFEREIETLRRLAHPDILQYVDHGRHGDTLYLVVELLSGRMLGELAPEFRGQAERVARLGERLARAFEVAHRAGVVHRDIKPGNIHVTAGGEPRILDYGLARWIAPEGTADPSAPTVQQLTRSNVLMGTIPYMSPEQLRAEPVDQRSDIFSLAAVLYELAAGRRPYEGQTIEGLRADIERGVPPPLDAVLPALRSAAGLALDTVLRRALVPQPQGRLQTMEELAAALAGAALEGGALPTDATVALLLPPRSLRVDRTLVTLRDRQHEMGVALVALESALTGRGSTLLLRGPAGIGKSLLADELVRRAHRRGFLVLTAATPPTEETVEHPAHAWLARAAEVFPGLLPRAGGEGPPESRGERLLAILASLGERMPLWLVLEDVHLASVALLRLLADIAGTVAHRRLVLLMTCRSDTVLAPEAQSLLGRILAEPEARAIDLAPLERADLRAMVEEAYPGLALGDATAGELERKSGGNPWFARGILRLLEERGALVRQGPDWGLREPADLPSSPEAETILAQRLDGLAPEDLELLEAAAVLGAEFDSEVLAALLARDVGTIAGRLSGLDTQRHLVQRRGCGHVFDERLTRDVLLARLAPDRRRELHERAANLLLARIDPSDPRRTAELASQFDQAGLAEQALPWMIKTGLLLREQSAPEEAIAWLARARTIVEGQLAGGAVPGGVDLADLDLALGECLHLVAREQEALEHLEKARGRSIEAGKPDVQARSLILLSHAHFTRGDLLQAQRKAHDAVGVARRASLEVERGLALSAEAKAVSRAGDSERAEELWLEAAELLAGEGRAAEAAEVQFRLANHHFRLQRLNEAEACYAAAAHGADRRHSPRLFAATQNGRGAVLLARFQAHDALPYFEEAAAVWREIGARRDEAMSRHNIAFCHQQLGGLDQAVEEYREVMALRRAIGEAAGHAASQRNRAEALHDLGRMEEALVEAVAALAAKRQLEDRAYLPQCLSLVAGIELTLGRLQRAREAAGEIVRDFPEVTQAAALRARTDLARADWSAGNLEAAAKQFSAVEAGLRVAATSHSIPTYWLLRFLHEQGTAVERLRGLIAFSLSPSSDALGAIYQHMSASIVARAAGDQAALAEHLAAALASAEASRLPEWTWQIQRDLGATDRAAAIIRAQAATIANPELRASYLAQRERAAVLRQAGADA